MSGDAKKKPVASEGGTKSAADLFQEYAEMFREAGSLSGAWNPEPDEWIVGMVRADVSFSENEIKALFGVKAHCLRNNPIKGRTVWAWTQTGKIFRATELSAYYEWDEGNTTKWLKRPIEFGFLRKNEETGQLGIGASVRGKPSPEPKPEIDEAAAEIESLVCTDKLPRYLAEAIVNKYGPLERTTFKNGWKIIKNAARDALAAEKQRLYECEQNQLSDYCRAFDPDLPGLRRKAPKKSEEAEREEDFDLSVQTSNPAADDDFVQNPQSAENDPYKTASDSVRTSHIRNDRKAVFKERFSSSSFPLVAAAFHEQAPQVDDDAITQLVESCRNVQADATDEEIAHFTRCKRMGRSVGNPVGFLLTAVPKMFASPAFHSMRNATIYTGSNPEEETARMERWRQEQKETLADASVSDKEKELIRLCLGLSEPSAKAQKAGQR